MLYRQTLLGRARATGRATGRTTGEGDGEDDWGDWEGDEEDEEGDEEDEEGDGEEEEGDNDDEIPAEHGSQPPPYNEKACTNQKGYEIAKCNRIREKQINEVKIVKDFLKLFLNSSSLSVPDNKTNTVNSSPLSPAPASPAPRTSAPPPAAPDLSKVSHPTPSPYGAPPAAAAAAGGAAEIEPNIFLFIKENANEILREYATILLKNENCKGAANKKLEKCINKASANGETTSV